MLSYLLGKQEKKEKKVEADFGDTLKTKLNCQFCEICSINLASKVSFGKEFKPCFTCPNCEIKAVGGSPQRLGSKFLISTSKFTELVAKQIINYQSDSHKPPLQQKKIQQNCGAIVCSTVEATAKVVQEFKAMKLVAKNKQEQLLGESKRLNMVPIFEEVDTLAADKKLQKVGNGQSILERALVGAEGLTFIDKEATKTENQVINDRFNAVRKESRIKLKALEDLIDEIKRTEF